jgi:UDP-glucose 4-epimerase
MIDAEIPYLIFSSTAAVYGSPEYIPIDENHPKKPINPYGRCKLMVEQILEDYDRAYGLKSVSLRYFNAAGSDPDGELGERHEPETHLIPLALQAASGRRDFVSIFGIDYDTKDGTCIRDYIHVSDLVDAHKKALDYLKRGNPSEVFNLGNGNGFSVNYLMSIVKKITKKLIKIEAVDRRAGDPPILVADASRAKNILGWEPKYTNLDQIIEHAWNWEKKFPWS